MHDRGVVAVTGGSGFVGANLVRRLLAQGHEVHVLVRPDGTQWRLRGLAGNLTRHSVDLCDSFAVAQIMAAIRPRATFHLAAHGAYSWEQDLNRMTRVNLDGTVNVVRASIAAGCTSVVCAGSSSEYGFKNHAPLESELVEPNSNYAITKAAATHFCQLLSRQSGVPITTLRLYSVYGPYEDPARLLPTVMRCGLSGELPTLAQPDSARDFIHVDDVVAAFLFVAERVTELAAVFNVGSGRQVDLRQVAELARRHFDIAEGPDWGSMAARSWDTSSWVSDCSRLISLGWRPGTSFEAGFASTAQWWSDHPEFLASPSAAATSESAIDLTQHDPSIALAGRP